jgi:hypothetical protein
MCQPLTSPFQGFPRRNLYAILSNFGKHWAANVLRPSGADDFAAVKEPAVTHRADRILIALAVLLLLRASGGALKDERGYPRSGSSFPASKPPVSSHFHNRRHTPARPMPCPTSLFLARRPIFFGSPLETALASALTRARR